MEHINYNNLVFPDKKINYGSYGKVRKCIFNDKEYAIKEFNKNSYIKERRKTIERLNEVNNIHLLTPKYWVDKKFNKEKIYLSDYTNGKSLMDYSKDDKNIKIDTLKKVKQSIISMHEEGIIHTDLSETNIYIENNEPKILDFDNACYKDCTCDIEKSNKFSQFHSFKHGITKEMDIYVFNILTFCILNDYYIYSISDQFDIRELYKLYTYYKKEGLDEVLKLFKQKKLPIGKLYEYKDSEEKIKTMFNFFDDYNMNEINSYLEVNENPTKKYLIDIL